jgi:hypothetical protein
VPWHTCKQINKHVREKKENKETTDAKVR